MNLIGQIIGFFGIGLNFFIFQQKDRKKLLMFKLISDFVWAAHYFMLNAYVGFAVAAIGVFRELVSYNKEKRWARGIFWPILFIVLGVSSAIIVRGGLDGPLYNFLPAIASALSVICFWQGKTSKSRIFAIPISCCMFAYSFITFSVAGMTNEVITVLSVIIGFFRNDRRKKH